MTKKKSRNKQNSSQNLKSVANTTVTVTSPIATTAIVTTALVTTASASAVATASPIATAAPAAIAMASPTAIATASPAVIKAAAITTATNKKNEDVAGIEKYTGKERIDLENLSLIEIARPSKIKFSSKPIGKSTEYELFDPNDFVRKKTSMQAWTDTIVLSEELRKKFKRCADLKNVVIDPPCCQNFAARMKKSLDDLVIYKANPIFGLGLGIDSSHTTPAYSVLTFFGALLAPPQTSVEYYSAGWYEDRFNQYLNENFVQNIFHFNAEEVGNYARFVLDAPLPFELDKITNITKEVKERILTANADRGVAVLNGYPMTFFYTICELPPGKHPIVFSYSGGKFDWFTKKGLKRYVMDRNGEVVGYIDNDKIIFDYPERFVKDVIKFCENCIRIFNKPTKENFKINKILGDFVKNFNRTEPEKGYLSLKDYLNNDDIRTCFNANIITKDLLKTLQRSLEEYEAGIKVEGLEMPVLKEECKTKITISL